MDFFPLFARLHDEPALVVGGGEVAARKLRLLRSAGARVTVNAPQLCVELEQLWARGEILWSRGRFDPLLVEAAVLVIAATDDPRVNEQVARVGRARHRLVNVVDDGARSGFITPSIVDRSPLVIAISTGGAMPVLARKLREWLEGRLSERLGPALRAVARFRARLRRSLPELTARRRFWERLVDEGALEALGSDAKPERTLERRLSAAEPTVGRVYLVGAGPGDPDLLTLRALQVLQAADIVLYDQLVSPGILERIRRDALRESVGKQAGGQRVEQEDINRRLIEYARQGLKVVRLKGGDPFVFGRGGEELQALRRASIDYEVVPGLTAAVACAAYAGIPLTHRDLSHQLSLATAHCQKTLECIDWEALARRGQTTVYYMPLRQLGLLSSQLLAHGLPANTPCALIENGTRADQRVLRSDLAGLATAAEQAELRSPSLLLVGETTALHDELSWFGKTLQAESGPASQLRPRPGEQETVVAAWAY